MSLLCWEFVQDSVGPRGPKSKPTATFKAKGPGWMCPTPLLFSTRVLRKNQAKFHLGTVKNNREIMS